MRVWALDPGAKRCGWAVLDDGGVYVASGISGFAREGSYQEHRIRLIEHWARLSDAFFETYNPDVLVSEIVPPTGGNLANLINRQLALTVITTIQAMACEWGEADIRQLSATTVKKKVAGSGKATKVQVRNGVLAALPELEPRRPDWTGKQAQWDEVDAIAIGLASLS